MRDVEKKLMNRRVVIFGVGWPGVMCRHPSEAACFCRSWRGMRREQDRNRINAGTGAMPSECSTVCRDARRAVTNVKSGQAVVAQQKGEGG